MTRFAAALKRENLTQGDVARALGIKRQSVNEWATGRRPIPGRRKIQVLKAFAPRFSSHDLDRVIYEVRPAKDNYEEEGA